MAEAVTEEPCVLGMAATCGMQGVCGWCVPDVGPQRIRTVQHAALGRLRLGGGGN
jgi:hypothetical protein